MTTEITNSNLDHPMRTGWGLRLLTAIIGLGLAAMGFTGAALATQAEQNTTGGTCAGIAQQWQATQDDLGPAVVKAQAVLDAATGDTGYMQSANAPALTGALGKALADATVPATADAPVCQAKQDIPAAGQTAAEAQVALAGLRQATDALTADVEAYRAATACQTAATAANQAVSEWAHMVAAAKAALAAANGTAGYPASAGASDLIGAAQAIADTPTVFIATGCKTAGDADAILAEVAALAAKTAAGQQQVDALNTSVAAFMAAQPPATTPSKPGAPSKPATPAKPKTPTTPAKPKPTTPAKPPTPPKPPAPQAACISSVTRQVGTQSQMVTAVVINPDNQNYTIKVWAGSTSRTWSKSVPSTFNVVGPLNDSWGASGLPRC